MDDPVLIEDKFIVSQDKFDQIAKYGAGRDTDEWILTCSQINPYDLNVGKNTDFIRQLHTNTYYQLVGN